MKKEMTDIKSLKIILEIRVMEKAIIIKKRILMERDHRMSIIIRSLYRKTIITVLSI
jgi:hypothetical protein